VAEHGLHGEVCQVVYGKELPGVVLHGQRAIGAHANQRVRPIATFSDADRERL
jgi:hypothetical protein